MAGHAGGNGITWLEQLGKRYAEKRSIVEDKIRRWAVSAAEGKTTAKSSEKAKEKSEEEMKKARQKGMKIEEYRAWRDREMWLNDFNMIRKKDLLEGNLTDQEKKTMEDLKQKLEKTGGVPPISKGLQQELDKKSGKA